MLTAKQQEILKVLHAGRPIQHDPHLQSLLDSGHVIEREGVYELTDAGLNQARVAKGFGEAIVDAILPGAGSRNAP